MSGIVQRVVTSPPNKRSLRAALQALFKVRQDEASDLRRIIESPDASGDEKWKAQRDLAALSKNTILRMAEVVDEPTPEGGARIPVLEPEGETPAIALNAEAESVEDPEAAA
ncbi:MAG TPA: hypothetical protein VHU44_16790 [Acidobacteriaceae bacterium]|jgi:hypothetical protein|nr:hypothetical protein [Acidobacteriaceae bacterium]